MLWPERNPIGQGGTLILVAGASGAGKDSLIDAAREHFDGDPRFLFPRRIITRGDQRGERHIALSEEEFAKCERQGSFCLTWRANGLSYGVPLETVDALAAGRTVVLNISRGKIVEARALWANTRVLHVVASAEARRQRLVARGRETARQAAERLRRADMEAASVPQGEWVSEIDNSGNLASAIERFVTLVAQYAGSVRGQAAGGVDSS